MENYENLNYTALDDKAISRKNFSEEQLAAVGFHGAVVVRTVVPIMALVVVSFVLIVDTVGLVKSGDLSSFIGSLFWALFAGVIIIVLRMARKALESKQLRLLKFALDNKLQYNVSGIAPPTEPIMFNIGHSRAQSNTLTFPDATRLASYQYTVGSGRNSRTYKFDFTSIKLPRKVPHLVLNFKGNSINPNTYDYHVQKLKLEGDFSKHFDLYAPPDYQIDALQIFTPDVMDALMNFGKDCDFELVNDELYVYQPDIGKLFDSADKLRESLAAVSKVAAQFGKQVTTYSDTRAGNVSSGLVAADGAKLKGRSWKRGIVLTVAVVIAYVAFNILSVLFRN
jgi:hypothetical protein